MYVTAYQYGPSRLWAKWVDLLENSRGRRPPLALPVSPGRLVLASPPSMNVAASHRSKVRLSLSLSLSSLGHYLAYERSDKIGRMRMELDGIYSRYPSLFPRRIIYPIGSLHEGWLTFGDSMGRAASSSFVASMIPSFTTA